MNRISIDGIPLWTPAYVSPVAWYDASDASTINNITGGVSQWGDKSSNANHLNQDTPSLQPRIDTRTLNGLNVIDFNGTEHYMSFTSNFEINNKFVIFVFYPDSDVANQRIFGNDPSPSVRVNYAGVSDVFVFAGTTAISIYGGTYATSEIYPKLSPYIAGWGYETTGFREEKNGLSLLYPITMLYSGTVPAVTFGRDTDSATSYFGGYFAEIIVINDYTTGGGTKLEGYLAWKWGLVGSLPVTHPYKLRPPKVGD